MSTFPSVLSSYTDPQATDRLNNPSHSGIEQAQNDGLEKVEAFIGTLSSVQGTLMYDIRGAASDGGGHVQSAAKGGTGQTVFTKGDLLVGQSAAVLSKLAIGADTTALLADSSQSTGVRWGVAGKFGGTGSDGGLTITSGTTTIDLGNAAVTIKNYTSISITGTGKLAFSNPNANGSVVILKSQGNVTLTSSQAPMIDMSSMGAPGGSGDGVSGSAGNTFNFWTTNFGIGGSAVTGNGGAVPINTTYPATNFNSVFDKYPHVYVGAGGGSGGRNGGTSGDGGRGGGSLIIECGGAWNFTTSAGISIAGAVGANSAGGNNGGGGGGGAGFFTALYTSLTTNSGTITATGGAGGNGSGAGGNDAGGGGGGSYLAGANKSGVNGGAGGNGYSLVAKNTEIA